MTASSTPPLTADEARALRVGVNAEKVFDRIDARGPCWLWTGAHSGGYGHVRWDGRARGVHRVVWELLVGPIAPGLQLDHLCRNTICCNPDHLDPVTQRENKLRGATRRGEQHPTAFLTDALVAEIRSSPETGRAIADRLGVPHRTISAVRRRKSWRHVP